MGIEIEYKNSRLIAVPAVHYRLAFAAEVNRICSSATCIPDSIAVELEPEVLEAVIRWIKELQPPDRNTRRSFPAMLGLVDSESAGSDASEILCLSVTDSIIEAIRCGLELNIPVFGIDIPAFYEKGFGPAFIEDAGKAGNSFLDYVSANEDEADILRDPVVDGNREDHMAGRLKCLLGEYQTVLFTGGLAHWKRIKQLMADEQVLPLDPPQPEYHRHSFERVIVHPVIARRFMDKFPLMSTLYEAARKNCRFQNQDRREFPDAAVVGQEILEMACRNYNDEAGYESSLGIHPTNTPSAIELESFIQKLSLVCRETSPDSQTLLLCAESLMPGRFAVMLMDLLMDIDADWASPVQFPELPVIVPSSLHDDYTCSRLNGMPVDVMSPPPGDLFFESQTYIRTDTLVLNIPVFGKAGHGSAESCWQWKDSPAKRSKRLSYHSWIWPPCEALLFGTAYQAGKMETEDELERKTVPFEGSMLDGVDIKATIRGVIRGDRKFHVKEIRRIRQQTPQESEQMATAVVLFSDALVPRDSRWLLLMAGTNIGDYVKDPARFHKVVAESGDYFISSLSYGSRMPVNSGGPFHPDSIDLIHGITLFGDPCLNALTGARWVENSNYKCCPVIRSMSFSSLNDYYLKNHRIDLKTENWQTALMLAAIPYASQNLVVMAPDGFMPDIKVKALAARFRVHLRILPLSHFPAERINQMRKRVLVRSVDGDGLEFAAETEQILGQKMDSFMELLPDFVK